MATEPSHQRASIFVDGQNLFDAVREAFGYSFPNYDIDRLAGVIFRQAGWEYSGARFYTGIPEKIDDGFWNYFWRNIDICISNAIARSKKRELGFVDAPAEATLGERGLRDTVREVAEQVVNVVGPAVGWVGFHDGPNVLDRIEVRRVGREGFQVKPRGPGEKVLDGTGTMKGDVIPKNDDRPGEGASAVAGGTRPRPRR
ncbi:MAG: hypothetical protein M5R36_06830 [Deltaproteobacteria bacterium]|nr:hypothetical protein [Deltaproteobacteria bacterium]